MRTRFVSARCCCEPGGTLVLDIVRGAWAECFPRTGTGLIYSVLAPQGWSTDKALVDEPFLGRPAWWPTGRANEGAIIWCTAPTSPLAFPPVTSAVLRYNSLSFDFPGTYTWDVRG